MGNHFLSVPENRMAVRAISRRVLAELEPDEVQASAGFIDPLIDVAAAGEIITVDTSDEAGSFGGADLMVIVVVPVVVDVVGNLLARLGERKIDELKERLRRKKDPYVLVRITVDDLEVIVKSTKSARGKRKIKKIVQAMNTALIEYLEGRLQEIDTTGQANHGQLRQLLTTHFNESELRDLCFDLRVDYDSLPGEGKGDKARELVAYLERRGRTSELLDACLRLRPNAF